MALQVPYQVVPGHREGLLACGLSSLEECLACERGDVIKSAVPGRQTLRLRYADRCYYLKRIRGESCREILNEACVLDRLCAAGLPVPEPAAFGVDGRSGALVTLGLPAERTLERVMLEESPGPERVECLAQRFAALVGRLHGLGVNHRDLYAGHVLVDRTDQLYLVDLGRAEMRSRVPLRRIIKDLAAVHSSLPPRGQGPALREAFLRHYAGTTGFSRGGRERLAHAVARKATRMRRHAQRQVARGEANFHVNG